MSNKKALKFICSIILLLALITLPFMTACTKEAPTTVPAPAPTTTVVPTPTPAPTTAPATTPAPVKPIKLSFAHQNPATSRPQIEFIVPWCKKLEELTKGRVKVDIYPAQTLVSERENYPAVVTGVCDITWVVLGMYLGRFPYTEAKTLPFLSLKSGKVNGEVYSMGKINSRMVWELYEELPAMQKEWSEVKMLELACSALSHIYTTKKTVHNQKELQGLKLRALAGGQTNALKALGASPVNMPIPEVYEAAQRGVLDGMLANPSQIQSFKLYDVFRYYTPVGMEGSMNATVMNQHKWDILPKDIQDALWSISGLWGSEFHGDRVWGFALDTDLLEETKKAGKVMEVVELDPGELEKWREIAGKPEWDKYVANMKAKGLDGQGAVDALLRMVEKYKP